MRRARAGFHPADGGAPGPESETIDAYWPYDSTEQEKEHSDVANAALSHYSGRLCVGRVAVGGTY